MFSALSDYFSLSSLSYFFIEFRRKSHLKSSYCDAGRGKSNGRRKEGGGYLVNRERRENRKGRERGEGTYPKESGKVLGKRAILFVCFKG